MPEPGVGYRALLRRGQFRALWLAGGATLAVVPVLLVVLVWTATQAFPGLSGGARENAVALSLALLGLSATIPTLLAAIVSGTLADRWRRLHLLRLVNGIEFVALLGVLADLVERPTASVHLPATGVTLPLYLVLLFPAWSVVSASATLLRPALNASLPRVVSPSELGTANGAVYAFGLGLSVVGALAVPLLLSGFGPLEAIAVPLGFLALAQAALLSVTVPLDLGRGSPAHRFSHDLLEGYRYLVRRPGLLTITIAALATNALASLAFVELGLYATVVLGVGQPIYLGALYAGASVGAAVGTLAVAKLPFEPRAGQYLAVLGVLQGLAVVLLSVLHWYPAALADLFLYGVVPGMSTTVFFALLQATVRNDMLGRVLAADEVGSYSLVPVGQYLGGTVTLFVGVSDTFLISGVGIAAAGVALAATPSVRRLGFTPARAPEPEPPGDAAAREVAAALGSAPK